MSLPVSCLIGLLTGHLHSGKAFGCIDGVSESRESRSHRDGNTPLDSGCLVAAHLSNIKS